MFHNFYYLPVLANPVCTSSAIHRTLFFVQISRTPEVKELFDEYWSFND